MFLLLIFMDSAVSFGTTHSIQSKILDEERTIWIATPLQHEADQPIPVLYVLDGQTHFEMVASSVRYLSRFNTIPPFLIVGIDNGQHRERDLTPYKSDWSPEGGGAKDFYGFMTQELMPWIEKEHKTSGFHVLAGKSYGGLFTLFAATQKQCPFQAFISISPSTFLADNQILEDISQHREQVTQAKFFFLTHATEDDIMRIPFLRLRGFLASNQAHLFASRIYEDESHESTFQPAIFDALKLMFEHWQVPRYVTQKDPKAVVQHYTKLIERFQLGIEIPYEALKRSGRLMQSSGHVDSAIEVFQETIQRYPHVSFAEYYLAQAYLKKGDKDAAKTHLDRAIQKSKTANDGYLEAFQKERDEL